MKCPRVIAISCPLKLDVRSSLLGLRIPSDMQEGSINAACLGTRKLAHEKRIDFGGFLAFCSVLSAMTRSASAVTFASASCFVWPYARTPGSSGTSAIHRPSSSLSKTILKDSASGGCGSVAIANCSADLRRGEVGRVRIAEQVESNEKEWLKTSAYAVNCSNVSTGAVTMWRRVSRNSV